EQEGQQTETEATGAPQKHHYTLNQQVGSITRFRQEYSLTAIYCTLQQDHFHEKRLTYPGYCCHRFPYRPPGAATSARWHVTKSGEPAGFGVSWM
ncbi:hypothetical protein M2D49_21440, partial [Klebsiella pneumoniae]|nr:hypothetical protein [Klebsiella pneumoniae]